MVIYRSTHHIINTIFIDNNKLHSTFYKYTHIYTNTGQRKSKKKIINIYKSWLPTRNTQKKYLVAKKKVSEGNTVKNLAKRFISTGICRLYG